jgi:hypothetical protein
MQEPPKKSRTTVRDNTTRFNGMELWSETRAEGPIYLSPGQRSCEKIALDDFS